MIKQTEYLKYIKRKQILFFIFYITNVAFDKRKFLVCCFIFILLILSTK